jgi:hypothetical protein
VDFEIPETLDGLTRDQITDLVAKALEVAASFNAVDDADFTDEHLADLEALGAFVAEGNAKVETLDAEAAARAERIANARAGVTVEPAVEEEVVEEEAVVEPEPVLAAGKRRITARAAKAAAAVTPAPVVPDTTASATITAAADVPGFASGQVLSDLDQVVEGAIARFEAMPKGRSATPMQMMFGVANIKKGRTDGLSTDNRDYGSLQEILQEATKETRLPGGSLTAAGGWCAPSETLYDLCTIESTDGLWDLPEVGATRGGINFTKGPDFSTFYAYAATAFQTEAQAEAGTTKTCIEVECPEFEDVRLDAAYVCISAGILTNAAYPELIRRYIEGTLIAQQHAVSARLLAAGLTLAGAAQTIANTWPNVLSILTALELVAEGERQRFRMARAATLEVVLPFWVRAAIRADFANRTGVELTNVTDQMIDAHFATRGLRVQFVYNFQELVIAAEPAVATDYPTSIDVLMYPAGTFVKLTKDVIRLDAVYDSVGLGTNTYTALFAEEGVALANICHTPRRLTIPFNVSGLTAAAFINQHFGVAPPLVPGASIPVS